MGAHGCVFIVPFRLFYPLHAPQRLLTYNPPDRISAFEALTHPYITGMSRPPSPNSPMPSTITSITPTASVDRLSVETTGATEPSMSSADAAAAAATMANSAGTSQEAPIVATGHVKLLVAKPVAQAAEGVVNRVTPEDESAPPVPALESVVDIIVDKTAKGAKDLVNEIESEKCAPLACVTQPSGDSGSVSVPEFTEPKPRPHRPRVYPKSTTVPAVPVVDPEDKPRGDLADVTSKKRPRGSAPSQVSSASAEELSAVAARDAGVAGKRRSTRQGAHQA